MAKRKVQIVPKEDGDPLNATYQALERFISNVPKTDEHKSGDPVARARSIANTAAAKGGLISGGLAIPAGPLGLLTVIPDLIAIWKLQAQMVADIAGCFGKTAFLTREQMVYCLFKHAAAQFVRDLVTRVGERLLVRRVSLRAMQTILQRIAGRVTERVIGKAVARWLPIAGAIGVGAYAYYDTAQVGKTAIELFKENLSLEPGASPRRKRIKSSKRKKRKLRSSTQPKSPRKAGPKRLNA
jgi:uncharacterized protein (DUF697 family)